MGMPFRVTISAKRKPIGCARRTERSNVVPGSPLGATGEESSLPIRITTTRRCSTRVKRRRCLVTVSWIWVDAEGIWHVCLF